ncbi:WD40 repeat domain-containing protein [Deinococcus planocerae]|uniref:WD40 repeat domain-containing protein n=1 Tax=Deinococcus planocerae TaxID=1737569 RepID=UPI0015E119D4|nr:WD40 repeat domain-containing protein [Deinococcus planocerae]
MTLLAGGSAGAVQVQARGSVPGGPAELVAVSGDARTVAAVSADRLGLFSPDGQRLALLSPTGRSLTSLVPAGADFLALDRGGTLVRVRDQQVTVLARDLCAFPEKTPTWPQLTYAAGTFAIRCGGEVLLGQPGAWRKLTAPPSTTFPVFSAIALSPDGRQLAASQGEKVLRYALPSLEALPTLTRVPGEDVQFMGDPVTPGAASALTFDPSGRRLAVGWGMSFAKAYNQSVTVYDLGNGQGRSLPSYPDWTERLAFSADGRFLLANGSSSPRIWDLGAWKRLPPPQKLNTYIGVRDVAWLGGNVVSASSLGALTFTPAGKQVAAYPLPQANLTVATYTADGKLLAVAGGDGQVHLIDARTGRVRWSAAAHPRLVASLRFNRAGTLLVSGDGNSSSVRFWDVLTGKSVGPTVVGVNTIAGFTPGDRELVLGGRVVPLARVLARRGEVFLGSQPGRNYRRSGSEAAGVTPAGDAVCERTPVLGNRGAGVRASLWSLKGLEQVQFGLTLPEGHSLAVATADCHTLAVSAQSIAGSGAAYRVTPLAVEVYDPGTGQKVRSWPTEGRVRSLALSPDGGQVAYLEEGRSGLVIGNVATGKQTLFPVPPVALELENVALTFRPDGKALLLGVGLQPGASLTILGLP